MYCSKLQTGRFYVYIYLYQIIENREPGPCNSLRLTDNTKYFLGLSLTGNLRETLMFHLARQVEKIGRCSC